MKRPHVVAMQSKHLKSYTDTPLYIKNNKKLLKNIANPTDKTIKCPFCNEIHKIKEIKHIKGYKTKEYFICIEGSVKEKKEKR